MDKDQTMLTTTDNPYNPFTHYDAWFNFDESMGYHTCGYLARITKSSDELSEADEAIAIDAAINEIVLMNVSGIYKKITNKEETKKNE